MKTILALLACLAFAAARYDGPENSFEQNKEYSFKYEAQVLTGIRDAGKYVSAFKLESVCKLTILPSFKVIAKLEQINVLRMVDQLPENVGAHDLIPREQLRPIQDERISRELVDEIAKPIRFTYQNGKVSDLECERDEPYWSVNLKRGLLNILEVKLESSAQQDAQEIQRVNQEIREVYQTNQLQQQDESDEETFALKENGIEGACRTYYSVKNKGQGIKQVWKVKDLKNCEHKPYYMTGILSTVKIEQCEKEEPSPMKKAVTQAEYEIKGHPRAFLITKALYKSQHMVAPLNVKNGAIATFTTQRIQLINVADRSSAHGPTNPVPREALKMDIPKKIRSEEQSESQSSSSDVQSKKELCRNLLSQIISQTKPDVTSDAVYKMAEVIEILKELPKQTVKDMIRELDEKKKELLMDLIPADDTPKAVKLIKELLSENTISEIRAMYMINSHILVAQPSPETLKSLLTFCQSSCSRPLKTTVRLAVGTLAGKIYKMKDVLPRSEVEQALNNVENQLKSELRQTSHAHDKVVLCKSIANSALPAFMPELEKLIKDRSEFAIVREMAVYGLMNYTVIAPEMVQKILMPVYLDTTKPVSVRIAAIVVLMKSKPSLPLLSAITTSLNREPSIEVAGFTFTHLSGIAKTSCSYETAKKVKTALLLTKPVLPKMLGSSALHLETTDRQSQIGQLLDLFTQKYQDTQLPNILGLKLSTIWDGALVEAFQGGINVRGLESIERILLGNNGLLWRVVKNQISPREAINELLRHVRQGEYETSSEESKQVSVFIKLLATEILHVDITSESIETLISKVHRYLPTVWNTLRQGYNFDLVKPLLTIQSSYIVPTPMGIPCSFNTSLLTLAGAYGNLRVDGMTNMNGRVTINQDIKTSSASVAWLSLGVHLPMVCAGHGLVAKLETKLPVKSVTDIDMRQLTLKTSIDTPQSDVQALNFEVKPAAYIIKVHPVESNDMIVKDDIIREQFGSPQQVSFQEREVFGLGVRVDSKYMSSNVNDMKINQLFMGKHQLKVVVQRGSSSPSKHEFRAALVCPLCPLSESQKHQFIFESVSGEEDQQQGWGWFGSSSSSRRNSASIGFDDVVPDSTYVNPQLKYKLAVSLKTKNSNQEKLVAGQVCALTDNRVKKFQLDTQVILPAYDSGRLQKAKVVTKAMIPEYLYEPSVTLRKNVKVPVLKTDCYYGDVNQPQKWISLDTKLECLDCDSQHETPKEYTPVKLETTVTQLQRLPNFIRKFIKECIKLIKYIEHWLWPNYLEIEDVVSMYLGSQMGWSNEQSLQNQQDWNNQWSQQSQNQRDIVIEAEVYPAQLKTLLKLKMDEEFVKAKVCPYNFPWSVPKKPITYQQLPEPESQQVEQGYYQRCSSQSITKKIRRVNDYGEEELCFSIEPVTVCKGSCRQPDQYRYEHVGYTCKPRYSSEAQRLLMEVTQGPVFDLRSYPQHHVKYDSIPERCEQL